MNKNRFLVFLFSLIPGAGQMYLGYMRRGICLMALFCAVIALTAIIGLAGLALPVIWAYAFFDTFRLRSALQDGSAEPDGYLFGLEFSDDSILRGFLARRHVLIGWCLILVGGWLLLDRFLLNPLEELFYRLDFYLGVSMINAIPSLIVALMLIALGVLLIRGRRTQAPDDSFTEYLGDGEDTNDE